MLFHQINSIVIPSVECLKIFVVKILRIEENLQKPRNFHPSKLICYTVVNFSGLANHTSEIIRISDFKPLWLYITVQPSVFLQLFW